MANGQAQRTKSKDEKRNIGTPDSGRGRLKEVDAASEDEQGIPSQTINPDAIEKAGSGTPGGESDFTGGIANLDETTDAPVEQNEYNK